MNYLSWALLALVAYTAVAPLVNVATTGDPRLPSYVAALYTNAILVTATVGVVAYTGRNPTAYLTHPKAPLVYVAGIALAVGILAYYRALSLGPVSVVAPVFGMFLVTSSVVGIVVLDETFTARKALGIVLAIVAVYLVSVE
jgi:transporter family protein